VKRVAWLLVGVLVLGGLSPAGEKPPASLTNSVGMKLVRIPAGTFLMGSPHDEEGRYDDEQQHEVQITRPFYLGVHEVTQAQFQKLMGFNNSWFSPAGRGKDRVKGKVTDNFPVESASWHDARTFCERLSALPAEKKAGRRYRLPSEAEWEHACRVGTESPDPGPFHFGLSLSAKQANFNGNGPYGKAPRGAYLARPAPVGSYKASTVGLFDMHGNVAEWCADWYDAQYYRRCPRKDPKGPAKGDMRVVRGGSWYAHARVCRAAHRLWAAPATRTNLVGFRVVCECPPR
jgi:formylglycine-generating enzyme required for sulfatase activity